jgi:glycosyltransferase involved in cell wall biosynthesis
MNQLPSRDEVLFSVVVPARNAAKTIRHTIDSVLTQTCNQIEIVVVDGRSDDGTTKILKNYRNNPKLRWISEPDAGIYDAMNKGTRLARGKYVLFLGADDYLYSTEVLKRMAGRIVPASDVAVGNIVYSNGRIFKSGISPLLYLLNTMHHQAVFYRRNVLLKNPYNIHRKICGDYELNLFLYKNGFKIQKIDELVSVCGAEGITKEVLLSGSLEEAEFKRELLGGIAYPLNFIFVMTKFLVRKLIRSFS